MLEVASHEHLPLLLLRLFSATRPVTAPRNRRRWLLSLGVAFAVAISLLPRGSSATVEEQRARLPPPAECPDKIEGTWAALVYYERQRTWYEFQLVIHRTALDKNGKSGAIEGEMTSHFWYGDAQEDKPPGCGPGRREVTINMPGKGSVDANENIAFGATTFTVGAVACGYAGGYNPDNFTGKIDGALHEFQSVNNDGGGAVNEPAVFRRIRCLNTPDAPFRKSTQAKPPAFAPPKRSAWSCGK